MKSAIDRMHDEVILLEKQKGLHFAAAALSMLCFRSLVQSSANTQNHTECLSKLSELQEFCSEVIGFFIERNGLELNAVLKTTEELNCISIKLAKEELNHEANNNV